MKYLLLILTFLPLGGCGLLMRHQTIHDYCVERLAHYTDYQECYEEQTETLRAKRQYMINSAH